MTIGEIFLARFNKLLQGAVAEADSDTNLYLVITINEADHWINNIEAVYGAQSVERDVFIRQVEQILNHKFEG